MRRYRSTRVHLLPLFCVYLLLDVRGQELSRSGGWLKNRPPAVPRRASGPTHALDPGTRADGVAHAQVSTGVMASRGTSRAQVGLFE
jgi:hypothetical protein